MCFALLASVGSACAEEIGVRELRLLPQDEGYALFARFDVQLSDRLESVLNRGGMLAFVVEFECERPRWYWLDARVVSKRIETRLSYHPLTRTYRLSAGALNETYSNLRDALDALSSIDGWQVLAQGDLEPHTAYEVGVRIWLDVNQLPKPIQLSALTNREWSLSSGWQRWGFLTGPGGKMVQ